MAARWTMWPVWSADFSVIANFSESERGYFRREVFSSGGGKARRRPLLLKMEWIELSVCLKSACFG